MSDFEQYTAFDDVIDGIFKKFDFTHALDPITVEVPSATADDVLRDIDQLRRDLGGYHGQLKAHNDLQRHCDNQRKRISELEGLYAKAKAEIAELRACLGDGCSDCAAGVGKYADSICDPLKAENEKLRELVRHMWGWLTAPSVSGAALHDISGQMHELRIEVDE